jgi:hypothetical protein
MSGIFSKPKMPPPPAPVEMPKAPVVDQARLDQDRGDALRRRRGRAATVLTEGGGMVGAGSVASKSLLGQ